MLYVVKTYISLLMFITCHMSYTNSNVVCPKSEAEWQKRSLNFHCSKGNHYHCLLTESYDRKEACTEPKSFSRGKCPLLNRHDAISNKYFACPTDLEGCPNDTDGYHSYKIFKYKRCLENPYSPNDREKEKRKIFLSNTTLMEQLKGDDNYFKIKSTHLLFGAIGIISILLFIIIICAIRCCCRRRKRNPQTVDMAGLLSKPLQSRSNLTLYDDIYGIRVSPSMPVLRTVPSRELLYDYPIPENRSLPLLNRSIPVLAELPPSRFTSREVLASHSNNYASMEPFYIEVVDSIRTGMSASSYLSPSPRPARRYDSLDRFQRFRDMNPHRGYRTMQTRRDSLAIQQRRSSL